jgi:hypothetical protein
MAHVRHQDETGHLFLPQRHSTDHHRHEGLVDQPLPQRRQPLNCHSALMRYQVLCSNKHHYLGAPLRNRTVDLLLTIDNQHVPVTAIDALNCSNASSH